MKLAIRSVSPTGATPAYGEPSQTERACGADEEIEQSPSRRKIQSTPARKRRINAKKFASQPHEYVIEQVQFVGDENVAISSSSRSQQVRLSFNHPTKFLAWVIADPAKHGKFTGGYAGATQEALAPLLNAKLLLNGHDRADVRVGAYYNKVVPYQANKANPDAGIYFQSFALAPCSHAPSGTLNFSRIDSAVLALTFKAASVAGNTTVLSNVANVASPETTTVTDATNLSALRVFGVNYNVLRILSGIRQFPVYSTAFSTAYGTTRFPVPNSELPQEFQAQLLRVNSGNAWRSSHTIAYNSLVSFFENTLATPSIAGTSLEPHLRSLLGNQECQGRVMTSLTVKTMWIGRSAGTRLRALLTSIRRPLRDYQAVGPRKCVAFNDGLRYSPSACESMRVMPGEGSVFHHE